MHHPLKRFLGQWKTANIFAILSLLWSSVSCSTIQTTSPTLELTSNPLIPNTDALVTFRVSLPEPLPAGDSLYISIVDEVTGLGLNQKRYIMEAEDDTHYYVILPFVMGSLIQYRYQRLGSSFAEEHLPDGRPVRYRLYHVEGPGSVEDIISRWTDTDFLGSGGELNGRIIDSVTGMPLPSIMVSAGGNQVFSRADGTFSFEILPPGTHNLVAYSTDGTYQYFQQGALIRENTTTQANIILSPSKFISVTFQVELPADTPQDVPLRLVGNLTQLGDTFADLTGGISTIVSRMPTFTKSLDGLYTLSLYLPAGIDLRYKYTLGDGLWNAERSNSREFVLRQIIVPDLDIQVHDTVNAWRYGLAGKIHFETKVPDSTPSNAVVYIQFDPGFGWTEPIPMWGKLASDSSTVWNYDLYSPLDMITTLRYRFCLDGLCNEAVALDQSTLLPQESSITISEQPRIITNLITAWAGYPGSSAPAIVPNIPVASRTNTFIAGVALQENYHPAWVTKVPVAISDIKNLHANWVFLQPVWAYTSSNPLILEYSPKFSPSWNDLTQWINHAHLLSLNVALIPLPEFSQLATDQINEPFKDQKEWNVWFNNYSHMVMNYTILASETGAEALVISDKWIAPTYSSESSQSQSFDTSASFRKLVENIRQLYGGKIIWATTYPSGISSPPSFIDLIDEIYIQWSQTLSDQQDVSSRQMRDKALRLLDRDIAPFAQQVNKPIILALAYPSTSVNYQMNAYNAMMMVVNDRPWLNGIVSTGYFPPLGLQDNTTSVHGKPASGVLWYWFPLFLGQ